MTGERRAIGDFLRLVVAALVGAVALAAVGAVPTLRQAGQAGLVAMGAGIGITMIASILAALPIAYSRAPTPASRQIAFMGAIAARMFATLILFAVLVLTKSVATRPFAIWTGVSYLVLLAIETVTAIRLIKRREEST